ncbi:MAG TPA: ANTAR domain-containing protein [Nevskiaceae bacterium]|nr:ANTAR domain-containing protein [Nevskiaceae bacterium]
MTTTPDAGPTVLLVNGDSALADALSAAGYAVSRAGEADDLYASVERHKPDAIVVAADSPSRDVLEHLAFINRKHPQPVLLFHDGSDDALVRRAMRAGVSAYVARDLPPLALRSLIEVSALHFEQTRSLRQALSRAEKLRAERKLVDAAKCRVMETLGLGEAAAYKHLQALAMNGRRSLAEVAHELLGSGGTDEKD